MPGYTKTRPYDPSKHDPWRAGHCSEQFRRREKCGPPVVDAFLPSRKRSPDDQAGRWWSLCEWHAKRRGVEIPKTTNREDQQ